MAEYITYIEDCIKWMGPNKYLQTGFIVIVSIVLGKLGELVVCKVIGRLARKTKTDLDDKLLEILHRPLFLSFVFIGLALAALRLELQGSLSFATLAFLKTMGIWVWLMFLIKFTNLFLDFLSRGPDRIGFIQSRTLPLLKNIAYVVLIGGSIYFVLISWHIDITAWLASAGIIGIALGFAAKDTLANLFAGVFILVDAPYKIGDFIILDSGERGRITQIGIRSTRLLTRDDVEITIPNSVMGNSKIINETGGPHVKERIRIKVGVAYGSDIDRVREALMQVAIAREEVCRTPEPRVRFRSFGDSGLDFELLVWIEEPVLRGRMIDALNTDVYKKFRSENIEIPYPKRDLYIKEMPGK